MISCSLLQLAKVLNGQFVGSAADAKITVSRVVTDSRANCEAAIFVALRGPHYDAHDFLPQVVKQGALCLVVEKETNLKVPQIIVENCKLALGDMAKNNRNLSQSKFIALTGSSGKTTVKEMIYSVLKNIGQTHATKGNFNNDIGAPLTLLDMEGAEQFAVIELGANHPGEIAYTAAITQPDVALINNVAAAHLQGFGDLHGVARAKGEIFSELKQEGIAIINNDDDFAEFWKNKTDRKILTFSVKNEADVIANNIQLDKNQFPEFELEYKNEKIFIKLPLAGLHNVNNALAAASCCLALGVSMKVIAVGLSEVPIVKGRLVTETLTNGCRLIDDTYNANLDSMRAAIELLANYPNRKVLVIGDMAELGEFGRQCHEQVGLMARNANIDALYSNGVLTQFSQSVFNERDLNSVSPEITNRGEHFTNQQQLIKKIINEANMGTSILVKGSRSAHMEKVVLAIKEFSAQQNKVQFTQSEEC